MQPFKLEFAKMVHAARCAYTAGKLGAQNRAITNNTCMYFYRLDPTVRCAIGAGLPAELGQYFMSEEIQMRSGNVKSVNDRGIMGLIDAGVLDASEMTPRQHEYLLQLQSAHDFWLGQSASEGEFLKALEQCEREIGSCGIEMEGYTNA